MRPPHTPKSGGWLGSLDDSASLSSLTPRMPAKREGCGRNQESLNSQSSLLPCWALFAASLALLLGLSGQVQAAGNFTWNSTLTTNSSNVSGNWSTSLMNATVAMNATSAAAPTNNLIFTGNNSITANNTFTGAVIGNITFSNTGNATLGTLGNFTLGGNSITLGGNISTTASSTNLNDTISLGLILSGNRSVNTGSTHTLTITGDITETGGNRSLSYSGSTGMYLYGNNTFSGGVTNGGTIYLKTFGTVGNASSLGSGSNITLNGNSGLRLMSSTADEISDKFILLTGSNTTQNLILDATNISNKTVTFTQNVTATSNGTKTFYVQGQGASVGGFTFNGAISESNPANATVSLRIGGSGSVTVTLNNINSTFNGSVTLDGNNSGKTYILQTANFGITGNSSSLGKNGTINIGSSNGNGTNILRYIGTGETSNKVINLYGNGSSVLDQSGASGLLKWAHLR